MWGLTALNVYTFKQAVKYASGMQEWNSLCAFPSYPAWWHQQMCVCSMSKAYWSTL